MLKKHLEKQLVIRNNLINYLYYPATYRGHNNDIYSLVFLHGWGANADIWKDTIEKLDSSHLEIYAIDLPGFGKSSVPKEPYGVQEYVETILEFINTNKLKYIILVGHSFGGRIGIKLASQYPDIITKLVLVDSAGIKPKSLRITTLKFLSRLLKPVFSLSLFKKSRKRIYKLIGSTDYINNNPLMSSTFIKVIEEDLTKYLSKISSPTYLVWGEQDKDTPLEDAYVMQREIPHSKLFILEKAGHFSFIDKPEKFIEILISIVLERPLK